MFLTDFHTSVKYQILQNLASGWMDMTKLIGGFWNYWNMPENWFSRNQITNGEKCMRFKLIFFFYHSFAEAVKGTPSFYSMLLLTYLQNVPIYLCMVRQWLLPIHILWWSPRLKAIPYFTWTPVPFPLQSPSIYDLQSNWKDVPHFTCFAYCTNMHVAARLTFMMPTFLWLKLIFNI